MSDKHIFLLHFLLWNFHARLQDSETFPGSDLLLVTIA
jgi:hypothetical protein